MTLLLAALLAAPVTASADSHNQIAESTVPEAVRVYDRVRPSVVRIDTAGGVGAGFVFHTRSHIATALHVVAAGRDIQVRPFGGDPRSARVVAYDSDHDLAILLLDEPLAESTPLPVAELPTVGQRAYVVGHPFAPQVAIDRRLKGLLDWSLSAGVVSAFNDDIIQVDAPVNAGNSGGPIVDGEGRLLGVVSFEIRQSDGPGFAIAAVRLTDLVTEIDEDSSFWGQWSGNVGLGWSSRVLNDGTVAGLSISLEAIAWDRVSLMSTFAEVQTIGGETGVFPRTEHGGGYLELGAAWRVLVMLGNLAPLYIQLGGGATFDIDEERTLTNFVRLVDPACPATGKECESVHRVQTDRKLRAQWRPFGSAALRLGALDLRYTVSLTEGDLPRFHRLTFSLML